MRADAGAVSVTSSAAPAPRALALPLVERPRHVVLVVGGRLVRREPDEVGVTGVAGGEVPRGLEELVGAQVRAGGVDRAVVPATLALTDAREERVVVVGVRARRARVVGRRAGAGVVVGGAVVVVLGAVVLDGSVAAVGSAVVAGSAPVSVLDPALASVAAAAMAACAACSCSAACASLASIAAPSSRSWLSASACACTRPAQRALLLVQRVVLLLAAWSTRPGRARSRGR